MNDYAHEVIFAIVNSSYAEDVMDVPGKRCRGGTVWNSCVNDKITTIKCSLGPDRKFHPVVERSFAM